MMEHDKFCYGCFTEKEQEDICPYCGYSLNDSGEEVLYVTPGTMLSGKYLTGKVLGQGGFGITYLGWDVNLDIRIAIKEFFPQGLVSRLPKGNVVVSYTGAMKDQFTFGVESFLREAKTLARFEHQPNIVTVRDFFKENGTAYMVMSYIKGLTLLDYLTQQGGKISVQKAIDIIMPVLDALKEIHKAGIMHRDISPDNIFIDSDGRVILIDFGSARQEMREKSKSLSVILKPGFAPEEQYRSRGKQGPWTDIYAVGATMYRCITGHVPPEAMDRLDEDDLTPPSQMGVTIEQRQEQVLLKALAVKAADRYQTVAEFQSELVASPAKSQIREGYASIKLKDSLVPVKADIKSSETIMGRKSKADVKQEVVRAVKTAALVAVCGLLFFGGISLIGGEDVVDPAVSETEEVGQTYAPAFITTLDADYYIDYENGTIPLYDLPIGARVVDPSWEWEYRLGANYSDMSGWGTPTPLGEIKPITWLVVAKDHYDFSEAHITLLAEGLIGRYPFDNSTNRGTQYGSNHWGDSGSANATYGLRPWLNSTGIHEGEGFYRAFSESFKQSVLTTNVPNKEWQNGSAYSTQDYVFIPSTTELGDTVHKFTYPIGSAYPFFTGAGDAKRVTRLGSATSEYWTRSPATGNGDRVRDVGNAGEFYLSLAYGFYGGIRPALNLKSGILVSEIRD